MNFKRSATVAVAFLILLTPFLTQAASSSTTTPAKAVFNTLVPTLSTGTQDTIHKVQDAKNGVQSVWDTINDWLLKHVGLSLKQVINAIGTAIIWVLGFAVQVLQSFIRGIQFVLSWTA